MCILLALQCGCSAKPGVFSNYRDLSRLRLIQTLGIDSDPAGIRITAASGRAQEGIDPILISRAGANIPMTLNSVEDYASDGMLFFSHCLFIMIGAEKAGEGIEDVIDFMQRDGQLRLDTGLILVRDAGALEFMTEFSTELDLTEAINALKEDLEKRGDSRVFDFRETSLALSERGAALICALETVDSDGSVYPEDGTTTCRPAGFGVLKDNRLAGCISYGWPSAAVGLMRGWLDSTDFVLPDGTGIRLAGSDVKVSPKWDRGQLMSLDVDARVELTVTSVEGPLSVSDVEFAAHVRELAETELMAALRDVIALEQELGADFLDFTTPVRLSGGEDFHSLPEDWVSTPEINISVQCGIDRILSLDGPAVYGR